MIKIIDKRFLLETVMETLRAILRKKSFLTEDVESTASILVYLMEALHDHDPGAHVTPFVSTRWKGDNIMDLTTRRYDLMFYLTLVKTNSILYHQLVESFYCYYKVKYVFLDFVAHVDDAVLVVEKNVIHKNTTAPLSEMLSSTLPQTWTTFSLLSDCPIATLLTLLKDKTLADMFFYKLGTHNLLILLHQKKEVSSTS